MKRSQPAWFVGRKSDSQGSGPFIWLTTGRALRVEAIRAVSAMRDSVERIDGPLTLKESAAWRKLCAINGFHVVKGIVSWELKR